MTDYIEDRDLGDEDDNTEEGPNSFVREPKKPSPSPLSSSVYFQLEFDLNVGMTENEDSLIYADV